MTKARRPRSDSAQVAVQAMKNAALPEIEPPKHVRLREEDRPFWSGIICARARDDWEPVDLVVAAQLARCQCDIETQSQTLEQEGSVLENARGTMVMNPRVTILEQLARREMALMRSLRMGGKPAGEVAANKGALVAEKRARAARADVSGEDMDAEEDSLLLA